MKHVYCVNQNMNKMKSCVNWRSSWTGGLKW